MKKFTNLSIMFLLGFVITLTISTKAVQASTITNSGLSSNTLMSEKDVTGDGRADYVVVWNNGGKRSLATYVAKSDGTFNEFVNTPSTANFTPDSTGRDIGSFADVTGDGKADYIVVWNNGGKRALATYVSKGDGTFYELVNTTSSANFIADTTGIDTGSFTDVNGDGRADYVVVWNYGGKRALATYLAKADGTFSEYVNTTSSANFIADKLGKDIGNFADVNGDAKADYVVVGNNGGKKSFASYVAKGDGTFNELVSTLSSANFTADSTGRDTGSFRDVTGDGKSDYVFVWNYGGKRAFATFVAKGDGTFNEYVNTTSSSNFTADSTGRDMGSFADVNGDGKSDYVLVWNYSGKRALATYIAKADGTFFEYVNTTSSGNYTADTTGRDMGSLADVNGDGKDDYVLVWNYGGKRALATYVAKADGTFNEYVNTTSGGSFIADSTGRDIGALVGANHLGNNLLFVQALSKGEEVVAYARQLMGNPYVWGGSGQVINYQSMYDLYSNKRDSEHTLAYYENIAASYPGMLAFDCSGLMWYVYHHFGYEIGGWTGEQKYSGTLVLNRSDLRPGDLIFFGSDFNSIYHVGMYIGNGQYIHAPQSGDFVKISYLSEYCIARRILN